MKKQPLLEFHKIYIFLDYLKKTSLSERQIQKRGFSTTFMFFLVFYFGNDENRSSR